MPGFWIALALCLALPAAHPFTIYPASLRLMARRRRPPRAAGPAGRGGWPTVAICMCAYNEERVIAAKMEGLLAMAAHYPGHVTLHVYVDGATDGTARILAGYDRLADVVVAADRRGKSWGMAQLVARSTGDLLLFTDANVMAGEDALTRLAASFADPDVGLASARLRYSNRAESATSLSGATYWEIEEAIKRLESATIGLVGVDGAMFAVRRDLYRAPPPHLIDDLYVSLLVLISGARIVSTEGVTVYERSAASAEEEFARKRRIACQAWNVHRALWPQLRRMPWARRYGYISHRMLKWWTPAFVTLAGLATLAAALAQFGPGPVAMALGIAGVALGVAAATGAMPASLLATTLYSLTGVGMGLIDSILSGRTYTVWAPAGSVRGPPDGGPERPPAAPAPPRADAPRAQIERTGIDV